MTDELLRDQIHREIREQLWSRMQTPGYSLIRISQPVYSQIWVEVRMRTRDQVRILNGTDFEAHWDLI